MRMLTMFLTLTSLGACASPTPYDIIIRNGTIYDGSGGAPMRGDVAINGDAIVAVGDIGSATGATEINAEGLAVAPGFINMLSWAETRLLVDGRSQSDIRQGVTLEVFGEGTSGGPLTPEMKAEILEQQGDIKYPIEWTTLAEFLDHLAANGVSPNVASFVGATTVREHVLGQADRDPTPAELDTMRGLVDQAMQEGALGVRVVTHLRAGVLR
jgi:N-acyl-D-amino-acid deacylase